MCAGCVEEAAALSVRIGKAMTQHAKTLVSKIDGKTDASILPIPKNSAPKLHADFRRISIMPDLTRIMERAVVQQFLYPAFLSPPLTLILHDQFAFRPTGSTTAAIISLLSIITNILLTIPYVIVISLDFSTVFNAIRRCWRN